MSLIEKLIEITEGMTDDMLSEIIDFAEFLKQKQDEEIFKKVISENAEALEKLAK
ncbi:DUF2281 domain-containing protein [Clostridium tagluense]|uniref:DUF2281 domain-containing protein n=1 Tax=Clostridium tagluense TaxID=360422 RepID=UPI001C0D3088|nr:DUF2281 domain-containing protein [Clostridium tagluense]MBU3126045.1 DUF2281 domain-containing protein [Clostridium tagluense]